MNYKVKKQFTTDPEYALQEILQDRGVVDIDNFMWPTKECELNPLLLDNILPAAENLLEHLNKKSNILIVVDSDNDGISSSAILWLYIKEIYPDANLTFIMHEHKQHGLDDKIEWIEQQNFNLVIVPDAGSYDVKEHQRLNDLGIDCIVLDHHPQLLDDDGNPIISTAPRTIIVNNQLSQQYSNKSLCGAGVVYKFCEVLDQLLGTIYAENFLDLVALGEIADVMDRCEIETNYLITEGLQCITNRGFQTLVESQSFSLKEKANYPYNGLTAIDVAFYIAPLINAILRVGSMDEKRALFYCFIEPNKILQSTKRGAKEGDTETAAEQTARVGKNSKSRQDKLKEKALEIIDLKIKKNNLNDNNIIIVEIEPEDKIPQEITGLIAMAVVSKYNKPCLIGRVNPSNDLLQGSARSNGNFSALPDLKQYEENSGFFDYVAGHASAHGFSIKTNQIDNFINYINTDLPKNAFENCYIVDYILDANQDNRALMYALAAHPEYFGNHIDEVKVVIENIKLDNKMIMGTNKDSIKISYNGIDYVKFKDTDFIDECSFNTDATLTVYGRININTWMGHKTVQCFINDYNFVEDKYAF